ncbi:tyrosine-type recombinase/integrase [Actinomadura rudentiformis]|uniref:Tyrosine-type recombinase/integrase n=1 Tax=Actinomadura rudentiformis TaxID=359158 RepID=A0A6H9YY54_9ACTN|nr:tyrosine-type recombinase/integrase [Actinomadura rudentiformis]
MPVDEGAAPVMPPAQPDGPAALDADRSEPPPLHGVVLSADPATAPGSGNGTTGPGQPRGKTGQGPGVVPVTPPDGTLAWPTMPLAADALAKLDADLGQVQVARSGGRRIYRRRIELLAEACTAETFGLVLDWLSSTRRASVATKRNYVDDLRRVWAPLARELGHDAFAVGCLSREHVRMWRLRQEGAGVAQRSIARYVACLSSLHVHAAGRLDAPLINPVTEDDRPRIPTGNTATSTPVLEIDQVRAVAACARSDLDLLVVMLLYTLAGRVTEICAADVTDLAVEGDRTVLRLTRKGGKQRALPLPDRCARLLRRMIGDRTSGPLLLDAAGRRLDRHDLDRISTRLGRAAAVLPDRDLTPHVWRASRITHMLDAGIPLAEVQEFADHANPATTIGYWERRNRAQRATAHVDQAITVFDDLDTAPHR